MVEKCAEDTYSRRRWTVEDYLRGHSSRLAGLYGLAADLVEDQGPDGWGYMVGHVGRELMNRLADHLEQVPLEDPSVSSAPLRPEAIARRLAAALEGDAEDLREAAGAIVEEVGRGGDRVRRRAEVLVAGREGEEEFEGPQIAAWVDGWRDLQRRFASFAHLPSAGSADLDPLVVEVAWKELTGLIAARIAEEPFFDSLDDLLEVAAAKPDAARASTALARLRPGTKRRFLEALSDPAWVGYLGGAGMFALAPPAIREGEMVRFPAWPEVTSCCASPPWRPRRWSRRRSKSPRPTTRAWSRRSPPVRPSCPPSSRWTPVLSPDSSTTCARGHNSSTSPARSPVWRVASPSPVASVSRWTFSRRYSGSTTGPSRRDRS
jgi:hypothetical protein